MGRLTRALLIAGGMYVAYYLGEISGYIKGAKVIMDATNRNEDVEQKDEEFSEGVRIDRVESGVNIASCNLDILRDRTEDLEERIKILDSAFNYHIMNDNRHGGN